MPVIPSFDFVPPLSDIHLLKQRCPSAMLDLARGHPPMALHQELNLKDGKVPPCTLPVHLHRLVERSAKAKSGHRASGGKVELPSRASQHSDSKAPRPALAKAGSDRRSDPDSLHVHLLPSVLPSVKTAEGAPSQPPRPPGAVRSLRLCEPGVRIFQGRAWPLVWALAGARSTWAWSGCQDNGGLLQQFWGPLNTKCPAQDQLGDSLCPSAWGMWYQ